MKIAIYNQQAYEALMDHLEVSAKQEAIRLGIDWKAASSNKCDHSSTDRQAITILRYGLFDQDFYTSSYPDIAATGAEPLIHYINYGDKEGRWPNPHFNPKTYRTHFLENDLDSITALYHYAVMGEGLGLDSPTAFDPQRYLQSNPELKSWLNHPLTHFLHLGKRGGLKLHHRVRLSEDDVVELPPKQSCNVPEHISLENGINVIGPLDKISGLGVSSRGYLEALKLAGAINIGARAQQREFPRQTSMGSDLKLPDFLDDAQINVVHMNGDTLPMMLEDGGRALFENRYNIAVWYWELPTIRPEWHVSLKYFHEFWAPTPFIAQALRQSTSKRVTVIPPYLSYLKLLQPTLDKVSDFKRFVYCFDANSILERKNPISLLEAFWRAFPVNSGHDDKILIFKVTYPDRSISDVERLYKAANFDKRIQIIDTTLSDPELHDLIGSATAYVSPHRSEGLGLTIVEAMGAEVPVITIPFGGLSQFITSQSSLPVHFHLQELEKDYFPYPEGYVWADPDINSLADNLTFAVNNPDEIKARARNAREEVIQYFCSDQLIDRYRSELTRLSSLRTK